VASDPAAANGSDPVEAPWWDFPTNDALTWWWEPGKRPSVGTLAALRGGLLAAAQAYERLGKVDKADDLRAISATLPAIPDSAPSAEELRARAESGSVGVHSQETFGLSRSDWTRFRQYPTRWG
jgi:hypothetical protein